MKNLRHIGLETTEEDCGVEIIDLDPSDVTGSSTSFWLASKLLQWQRSPNKRHYRRYWRLTCALCILLFIVILFSLLRMPFSLISYSFKTALYPRSHSSSMISLPAPPLPPQDGIACLADASWSPDSTSIAVLGYQDCPKNDYVSGLVNLYNAQSRQLVSQLQPGNSILLALGRHSPSPQRRQHGKQPAPGSTSGDSGPTEPPEPLISYDHVIWSPDGQRLAVTFEGAAQQSSLHGVVLANRDGRNVQVLLQQQQTTPPFYTEWDLDRSVRTQLPALALRSLPLALAYHWRANGQLVPETVLTNTTTVTTVTNVTNNAVSAAVPFSSGPVGNPDGATSFTIWQPGSANFILLADSSSVYPMYTWSTDFAAWSPDGRYLIDGISLSGLLKPPGQLFPSHKALVAFSMERAPLLPIHDAALLTAVDSATAIAWSPDGRELATYTAGNVNLYDCINGHKLASFHMPTTSAAPPEQAVVMRWSPDGSHLLLSNIAWGLVSLWSLQQLPK